MPNQEPAFAWPFGNGPVRVGTQGLFRLWCQYAMMMLTNTFCRCAHSNCATSGTFSFLSKRRNRYRVLCTRFQYVYRDRRKPRRFRFHQQKIIFERIVIRSSPLEIHLNRKGQTKHSIRSLSAISTLYKTLFTWRHGCHVGVPKPVQKPGPVVLFSYVINASFCRKLTTAAGHVSENAR